MTRLHTLTFVATLFALACGGCGVQASVPDGPAFASLAPPPDAGHEAAVDAGPPGWADRDATPLPGVDAGPVPMWAVDAGSPPIWAPDAGPPVLPPPRPDSGPPVAAPDAGQPTQDGGAPSTVTCVTPSGTYSTTPTTAQAGAGYYIQYHAADGTDEWVSCGGATCGSVPAAPCPSGSQCFVYPPLETLSGVCQ